MLNVCPEFQYPVVLPQGGINDSLPDLSGMTFARSRSAQSISCKEAIHRYNITYNNNELLVEGQPAIKIQVETYRQNCFSRRE